MSFSCQKIQEKLAENGNEAISKEPEIKEHLSTCPECFSIFEALNELDDQIEDLPELDAPEISFDLIFQSKSEQQSPLAVKMATQILFAVYGNLKHLCAFIFQKRILWRRIVPVGLFMGVVFAIMIPNFFSYRSPGYLAGSKQQKSAPVDLSIVDADMPDVYEPNAVVKEEEMLKTAVEADDELEEKKGDEKAEVFLDAVERQVPLKKKAKVATKNEYKKMDLQADPKPKLKPNRQSALLAPKKVMPPRTITERRAAPSREIVGKDKQKGYHGPYIEGRTYRDSLKGGKGDGDIVADFLAQMTSTEGLKFIDPQGYWTNTYVPGDPYVRHLSMKLINWDRSSLQSLAKHPILMENGSLRVPQPLDSPRNAALAVFLSSNAADRSTPTRKIIQIALKGSERNRGIRPAMNVGLVFDLSGDISKSTAQIISEIIHTFEALKDIGDQFSVTVAGRPGGIVIRPDQFRYGPIKIALENLFEKEQHTGGSLTVLEALKKANHLIQKSDDPTAPLGSSLLVFITHRPLGTLTQNISNLAHQSAIQGMPYSVIGIGDNITIRELDEIVLAGQGNRRLLLETANVKTVVEKELSAVSRVIARALRLRIQLAPGVKLVSVIGSQRLGEPAVQRVKEAEKSIDVRLSRNLGIEADRGKDEAGIQMIIPSFYAGDTHIILIDCVVIKPGPICDVTLRYKDLIHLKNNVAMANLTLDNIPNKPGPLEYNVFKNYLAHYVGQELQNAGNAARLGRIFQTRHILSHLSALVNGLMEKMAVLEMDPVLMADLNMFNDYQSILASTNNFSEDQLGNISNSLILAGRFKVHSRPPLEQ